MTMADFDAEQASAAVPVVAVVTGEAILAVRDWMLFRAYHVRANSPTGMQLSRHFRATVKGFNDDFGYACRNWADVAEVTKAIYAARAEAERAAKEAGR
jgi:hypothetical protein